MYRCVILWGEGLGRRRGRRGALGVDVCGLRLNGPYWSCSQCVCVCVGVCTLTSALRRSVGCSDLSSIPEGGVPDTQLTFLSIFISVVSGWFRGEKWLDSNGKTPL